MTGCIDIGDKVWCDLEFSSYQKFAECFVASVDE